MRSVYRPLALSSALLLQLSVACGDARSARDSGGAQARVEGAVPSRVAGRPALCERAGADKVREVFCAAEPASTQGIQSLSALEQSLGLTIAARVPSTGVNPVGYYPAGVSHVFATLLSHSTALSGRFVSELNPRVILMTDGLLLAFTRGVQQVEIAAQDRDTQAFNFYLLSFEQACNAAAEGCSTTQRFGPYIESGWLRLELRDAEDLKNSPDDCRQCHQRGLDKPVLLMRELNGPWTHFFSRDDEPPFPFPEPTGGNLMQDFLAAHGDEPYAGLQTAVLRDTQPFALRKFADVEQPLLFDSLAIMNERWARVGSSYPAEPQRSATWDAAFSAFKRGEQLALPYFAPRATDPDKTQRLTAAYQRFAQEGTELPDLSDVFPDDAQLRAEIGLQVEPGAGPMQALVQACGSCHNDVLDQTLTRARFNIALGRLDRAELDLAITRLRAPAAEGGMPPRNARQLDEAAREALIEYLERSERPMEDDAFLELAAERGMASAR